LKNAQQLLYIIKDILDFNLIRKDSLKLLLAPVKIRDIASELVENFRTQKFFRKLDIISEIDDDVPEFVVTDRERLKRIIWHLMTNAIKYT